MNKYIEKIKEIAFPNKYTKYYCNIVERAMLRDQDRVKQKKTYGYVESHHILPKSFCLGGDKDKENLVLLTAKEHFLVHLCATRMFGPIFKNKMTFAFLMLRSSNKQQKRITGSRMYSIVKSNVQGFIRFYKGREVKYLYDTQIKEASDLKNEGWSKKMPDEYKAGRVGNMKGKKHSEETKEKLKKSFIDKPRVYKRGYKRSPEIIQKWLKTKRDIKINNPKKHYRYISRRTKALKKLRKLGKLSFKGEKNPMYGKSHSDIAKLKMSEKRKAHMLRVKSDPEGIKKLSKNMSDGQLRSWGNPKRKNMSKIFNSKSMQKDGMHPQRYYDEKLKPLLWLGFLPTFIAKYKLLDRHSNYIKPLILKWGTKEDLLKFEKNKKMGAGSNKTYIKFQEQQYVAYTANKRNQKESSKESSPTTISQPMLSPMLETWEPRT